MHYARAGEGAVCIHSPADRSMWGILGGVPPVTPGGGTKRAGFAQEHYCFFAASAGAGFTFACRSSLLIRMRRWDFLSRRDSSRSTLFISVMVCSLLHAVKGKHDLFDRMRGAVYAAYQFLQCAGRVRLG